MKAAVPPPGPAQVREVDSFSALLAAPLADGVNALCWPRRLEGDFGEVVAALGPGEGIVGLDPARLEELSLSAAGAAARDAMLDDLTRLQAQGLAPELNCIHAYPRDDHPVLPVDVHSFHADSAPIETATWLCTYYGPASEGLAHREARRRVDEPAIRAALLAEHGGPDDAGFSAWLRAHGYDLHYAALPGARPWSFGPGFLWRIAVDWPGSPVPPCIHRAPLPPPGAGPRLLLIC